MIINWKNMFEIETDKYLPTQFYKRNQLDVFRCLARNKFIKKNKEELIRQGFVKYLVEELKVPIENIEVEVPLTKFKKGIRGRADIVIYGNDENKKAVCLIECKDKSIHFTDDVYDQAYRYHDYILPNLVMITNGESLEILFWDSIKEEFKVVTK